MTCSPYGDVVRDSVSLTCPLCKFRRHLLPILYDSSDGGRAAPPFLTAVVDTVTVFLAPGRTIMFVNTHGAAVTTPPYHTLLYRVVGWRVVALPTPPPTLTPGVPPQDGGRAGSHVSVRRVVFRFAFSWDERAYRTTSRKAGTYHYPAFIGDLLPTTYGRFMPFWFSGLPTVEQDTVRRALVRTPEHIHPPAASPTFTHPVPPPGRLPDGFTPPPCWDDGPTTFCSHTYYDGLASPCMAGQATDSSGRRLCC